MKFSIFLICFILIFGSIDCSHGQEDFEDDYDEVIDEAEYIRENMNLEIISPSGDEDRKVEFVAETGLTREEIRVNRVKLYWVVTGDNLNRPWQMSGNDRSQRFRNGDYDVELTATDRFGQEYEAEGTSFTVDVEGNEPRRKGFNRFNTDSEEAQYVSDNLNLEIISPSGDEDRKVEFVAETGLSRDDMRVYRVKLYWVVTGDNLNRPLQMSGNDRSQRFRNGDYDVELTATDVFGREYGPESSSFTVDEEGNDPPKKGVNPLRYRD